MYKDSSTYNHVWSLSITSTYYALELQIIFQLLQNEMCQITGDILKGSSTRKISVQDSESQDKDFQDSKMTSKYFLWFLHDCTIYELHKYYGIWSSEVGFQDSQNSEITVQQDFRRKISPSGRPSNYFVR